jgi:DNA-binding Lrp family transcriptional regulator
VDKIDYLILSELERDASLSFVDVAKKVGATPCTIKRRYEKLKKDGVIFGCTVSLDLSKLGYQGKTFILVNLTPNSEKSETIEYLRNIPNMLIVTQMIGPYDLMAIAPITDLKSLQVLLEGAKKAPNIQRVEFSCVNNVDFPVSPNYKTMLSEKSKTIACAKTMKYH